MQLSCSKTNAPAVCSRFFWGTSSPTEPVHCNKRNTDTTATLHPHLRSTCTHLSQAMPCQLECAQLPMRPSS